MISLGTIHILRNHFQWGRGVKNIQKVQIMSKNVSIFFKMTKEKSEIFQKAFKKVIFFISGQNSPKMCLRNI